MAEEEKKPPVDPNLDFRLDRVNKIKQMYADECSTQRWADRTTSYNSGDYTTAEAVRTALNDAIANRESIVEASKKLYAINPIYASVINYLSNMYMFRYKVVPHKSYTKSKAELREKQKDEDFQLIYNLMLEVVDGLSIETKFPALLTTLFTCGAVYLTTYCDEESLTVDSLMLPDKYCRKIGDTQYGTAMIEFDFSYFQSLGLSNELLKEYLKQFPAEFQKDYNRYLKDSNLRWQALDPHFSTGVLLNETSTPTLFYMYGSLLDFEQYQDNELERNENQLRYLVVHKMPLYQDKLIFEMDEVAAIHSSIKRVVDTSERARLITTYGDVSSVQLGEPDTSENKVLAKAYKAIFNNAGLNDTIFTGESVEALKASLRRDKNMVWNYIQQFLNFYTIAINNWYDFKEYTANIDILNLSPYTYSDDMEIFKNNATLGVGKLDYFIASGIKQKNVADQLNLETFLKLDQIRPMQTSYTQTAVDRQSNDEAASDDAANTSGDSTKTSSDESSSSSGIEPSGDSGRSSSSGGASTSEGDENSK